MNDQTSSRRAIGRHVELYAALLVLYPREFRREYGTAMVQLFHDELTHRAGGRGRRIWPRMLRDLLLSVPLQRMEALMRSYRSMVLVASAFLVFALGLAVTVTGASEPGELAAAVAVALAFELALVACAALYRRAVLRPAEAVLRPSRVRHWWAVIAAALAIGGLAALIVQLAREPSAENVGHLALGTPFCGLIVWGLVLRARRGGLVGNWLVVAGLAPFLLTLWLPAVPVAALLAMLGALAETGRTRDRRPAPLAA